ncbi:unnamed protein product [Peronospora belbahrii]|uniref:Uncharacterized protein n=1 Tax=Peronospora belbahrii TaxID=622444 RepID=A0AAU9L0E7_9STRA|nr:unnamed protein product [Peronospora belbahrii]CAH0520287.1 unnamed protein product [Peronospora belbahrii]
MIEEIAVLESNDVGTLSRRPTRSNVFAVQHVAAGRASIRRIPLLTASWGDTSFGLVTKFLGLRVTHSNKRENLLDQEEAILDIIQRPGCSRQMRRAPIGADCYDTVSVESEVPSITSAPGQPNVRTLQLLVGSLLWVARCTRPDIAFAVHKATRQTHAPRRRLKTREARCTLSERHMCT